MSAWERFKFALFGEGKAFVWIIAVLLLLAMAFWGGVAFILAHFLQKYW